MTVIRLAEVLSALSLTTDLGTGVPFEKGLRTCVVATALAAALPTLSSSQHASAIGSRSARASGIPDRRTGESLDLVARIVQVAEQAVLAHFTGGPSGASAEVARRAADQLVVSPRNVQHHLDSVYDKIGRRTRAGAAVFAVVARPDDLVTDS